MLIFVVKPKDNSEKNNDCFKQGFLLLMILIAKLVFCAWAGVWVWCLVCWFFLSDDGLKCVYTLSEGLRI